MSSPVSTMASLSPVAMIKRRLSPAAVKILDREEPRCAICLDGGVGPSKRLQCQHEFCVLCIAKHAQTKLAAGQDALCPCCLAPMQQSELKALGLATGFTLLSQRCSSELRESTLTHRGPPRCLECGKIVKERLTRVDDNWCSCDGI